MTHELHTTKTMTDQNVSTVLHPTVTQHYSISTHQSCQEPPIQSPSIVQSTNQPTNQPIKQSINKSIKKTINLSIKQSINLSINQSSNPSISWSSHSPKPSFNPFVRPSIEPFGARGLRVSREFASCGVPRCLHVGFFGAFPSRIKCHHFFQWPIGPPQKTGTIF